MLIGYVVLLCVLGVVKRHGEPVADASAFHIHYLLQPFDWIADLAVGGLAEVARFLLMGLLVALSLGGPANRCRLGRLAFVLLAGLGLSVLVLGFERGRLAGPVFLVLPLAGYLFGAWIGRTCMQGCRATLWLVPKLGLLLLVVAAGVAGLALSALDDAPLAFEPPAVTSAEKRRLAHVIRSSHRGGGESHQLRLSERDVNLLLAMGLAHSPLEGKATVTLVEETATLGLSLRTPFHRPAMRYLNVHGACHLGITAGRVEARPGQLQIGRVRIPKIVLDFVLPALISSALDDPDLRQVVTSIDSIRLKPGAVETVYRSGSLNRNVLPSLLTKLGQKPNAVSETRVHFRHLVSMAEKLPEGDRRFAAFVQTAFALAQRRSREEDPLLENRAAILALAILLGHARVENLVGPVTDGSLRRAARQRTGRVTLRGRGDWTRHFFVSAALALLSNEVLSDGVGLFKEELDAGEGGSGFSFSDLLADRAGTLFALAATRDEQSARRMQTRLAAGFSIDEVFPPAADLPEGIPDAQLQAYYGGVGGPRYAQVVRELERRLSKCAALHPRSPQDGP